VKSQVEYTLRHRAVAGKAMEYTTDLLRVLLDENSKRILFGFTRVDHDWQPPLFRQSNLLAKDRLLYITRREVVVVIEPDLSEASGQRLGSDDGSRRLRGIGGTTGELACRVWMHADGKPDAWPPGSQILRLRDLRPVLRGENHERIGDPRALRAIDNVREIGSEFGARDVTV